MSEPHDRLREVIDRASAGLTDRRALVELTVLAAVAGEHLLVAGPPGTAKSEAIRRVAALIEARSFEYLLGRFTEPSEIFGPVDLRRLQEGVYATVTEGMLPEAEIAFLDEVFRGSSAILNALLTLLNERTWRRGGTVLRCPLRVAVGATNELPDDPGLAAFADRFLLRVFVEPVPDSQIEELLTAIDRAPDLTPVASTADLDALHRAAAEVDLRPVRPLLADALLRLREAGVELSDRRMVRSQALLRAAAALDGRREASARDLWTLVHVAPTAPEQALAREVLEASLVSSANGLLPEAAELAARGPAARAHRLLLAAQALLAAPGFDGAWRTSVEALLHEIDASLDPARLPDELAAARRRLAALLGAG